MKLAPIGVAVVNWNGRDDTLACLESLRAADPRPARVVVVDNASTDDSARAIAEWIALRGPDSGFEIVVSGSNRGFAGASNVAVAHLARDAILSHFLLLNNDATAAPDCFAGLTSALAEAPATGIMGVTILERGSEHRTWYAGGSLARVRVMGQHHRKVPQGRARVVPTEFVSGCAMVISRAAWSILGPLPECYFMYFEDVEYCFRARAAGIEVGYAPHPVIHHRVASTLARGAVEQPLGEYRFERSRALCARRNLHGATRAVALTYLLLVGLARAALRTARGRPIRAWAAYRGTVAGLLAIEGQRQSAQAAAAQSASERAPINQ